MKLRSAKLWSFVFAVVCCLSNGVTAHSQSGKTGTNVAPLPSVDDLLAKSLGATGGLEAWLQLTSMHMKADVSMSPQGLTGTMDLFSKAPDEESDCLRFQQGGFFCRGFDGKNGWQDDSQNGLKPMEGKTLDDMRRDSDFYTELHRRKNYSEMKVARQDEFDGLNVYVVSAVRTDGQKQELYYARDSGLMAGIKDFGETTDKSKTYFLEDYKQISGQAIRIPTKIRLVSDAMSMRITVQEIIPNADIADSVFAQPAKSARDAQGVGQDDRPDNGKVTDGVYRSDFFGFQYTLPQGWTVHGEETQKVLMDAGKDLLAGNDQAKRSMMETASKRTFQLLTVFEYPLGTPEKSNRSIQVAAENVSFAPGIKTGEDYILNLRKLLANSQVQSQFQGEPLEQKLDGVPFYHQTIVLMFGEIPVYETYYCTIVKGYALSFIFVAKSKEGLAEVERSLESFQNTASTSTKP